MRTACTGRFVAAVGLQPRAAGSDGSSDAAMFSTMHNTDSWAVLPYDGKLHSTGVKKLAVPAGKGVCGMVGVSDDLLIAVTRSRELYAVDARSAAGQDVKMSTERAGVNVNVIHAYLRKGSSAALLTGASGAAAAPDAGSEWSPAEPYGIVKVADGSAAAGLPSKVAVLSALEWKRCKKRGKAARDPSDSMIVVIQTFTVARRPASATDAFASMEYDSTYAVYVCYPPRGGYPRVVPLQDKVWAVESGTAFAVYVTQPSSILLQMTHALGPLTLPVDIDFYDGVARVLAESVSPSDASSPRLARAVSAPIVNDESAPMRVSASRFVMISGSSLLVYCLGSDCSVTGPEAFEAGRSSATPLITRVLHVREGVLAVQCGSNVRLVNLDARTILQERPLPVPHAIREWHCISADGGVVHLVLHTHEEASADVAEQVGCFRMLRDFTGAGAMTVSQHVPKRTAERTASPPRERPPVTAAPAATVVPTSQATNATPAPAAAGRRASTSAPSIGHTVSASSPAPSSTAASGLPHAHTERARTTSPHGRAPSPLSALQHSSSDPSMSSDHVLLDKNRQLQAQVQELEFSMQQLQATCDAQASTIKRLQTKVVAMTRMEHELADARQQLEVTQTEMQAASEELRVAKAAMAARQAEMDRLTRQVADMKPLQVKLQETSETLRAELETSRAETAAAAERALAASARAAAAEASAACRPGPETAAAQEVQALREELARARISSQPHARKPFRLGIDYAELEFEPGEFERAHTLRKGAFGVVQFGRWSRYDNMQVAVKTMSNSEGMAGTDAWMREGLVMNAIRSLQEYDVRAQHLVTVFGLSMKQHDRSQSLMVVMELMEGGAFSALLRQRDAPISLAHRVRILWHVARGLAAMHENHMVHADVKCDNVLLSSKMPDCVAKLADFGLTRLSRGMGSTTIGMRQGSLIYLGPELHEHEEIKNTAQSDVYALGMLIYEGLTGWKPFFRPDGDRLDGSCVFITDRQLAEAVVAGERPTKYIPLPADTPSQLSAMVDACWRKTPKERPTAHAVASELEVLYTAMDPAGAAATIAGLLSRSTAFEHRDTSSSVAATDAGAARWDATSMANKYASAAPPATSPPSSAPRSRTPVQGSMVDAYVAAPRASAATPAAVMHLPPPVSSPPAPLVQQPSPTHAHQEIPPPHLAHIHAPPAGYYPPSQQWGRPGESQWVAMPPPGMMAYGGGYMGPSYGLAPAGMSYGMAPMMQQQPGYPGIQAYPGAAPGYATFQPPSVHTPVQGIPGHVHMQPTLDGLSRAGSGDHSVISDAGSAISTSSAPLGTPPAPSVSSRSSPP